MKSVFSTGLFLLVTLVLVPAAQASTVVWGMNASFSGSEMIEAFNLDTGAKVDGFLAPRDNLNGRGLAVVGTTIYYSNSSEGKVFITDSVTHADMGVAFDTCNIPQIGCLNGIATIAWDGTDLWITGYNGSNNAYKVKPNGTWDGTVVGFGNGRDGFEVANNHLVANRGDGVGPYDLFDLNGNLITSNFINAPAHSNGCDTGITFDGTDYIVSDPLNCGNGSPFNQLLVFDAAGNFVAARNLTGTLPPDGIRLLEDLSALGNIASNPAPSPVPEPTSLVLLGSGLLGAIARFRKGNKS